MGAAEGLVPIIGLEHQGDRVSRMHSTGQVCMVGFASCAARGLFAFHLWTSPIPLVPTSCYALEVIRDRHYSDECAVICVVREKSMPCARPVLRSKPLTAF